MYVSINVKRYILACTFLLFAIVIVARKNEICKGRYFEAIDDKRGGTANFANVAEMKPRLYNPKSHQEVTKYHQKC